MIEWGYWSNGVSLIAKLASIGFLPAKAYFDPEKSPLKNPTGQYHLARYLHHAGDLEYAAIWYRRSAESGDPSSMY
jgi:TPR repeat protein